MNRREFIRTTAGGFATGAWLLSPPARSPRRLPIRAVAFDGFVIFDPRPVFGLAETLFPGQGAALGDAWRTRQFEYQWLRTLSGRWEDFWRITEEALSFAAGQLKCDLTPEKRTRLMQAYLDLRPWQEVPAALRALKESGLRLALLSNMTTTMLKAGIGNTGLEGVFDHILSTDRVRAHKPDPRAYSMGTGAFGLKREEILFAAFAGWDAAGATWFGYPVYWVNRLGVPPEELGVVPEAEGHDLVQVVTYLRSRDHDPSDDDDGDLASN